MFVHIEQSSRAIRRLMVAGTVLLVIARGGGIAYAQTPTAPQGQEFAPVPSVFERVHGSFSGRILTIALSLSEHPVYEVKFLTESGNVLMLSYDAMSLRLDSVVGHREGTDEKGTQISNVRGRSGGGDGESGADGRDGGGDDGGDDGGKDDDGGHDGGGDDSGGGDDD